MGRVISIGGIRRRSAAQRLLMKSQVCSPAARLPSIRLRRIATSWVPTVSVSERDRARFTRSGSWNSPRAIRKRRRSWGVPAVFAAPRNLSKRLASPCRAARFTTESARFGSRERRSSR